MLKNDFSRAVLADVLDINPAKTNRNVGFNICSIRNSNKVLYGIKSLSYQRCAFVSCM
jgi:hypothetical protein